MYNIRPQAPGIYIIAIFYPFSQFCNVCNTTTNNMNKSPNNMNNGDSQGQGAAEL